MVIGNIPVWRNSNNNTLYFCKSYIVIEEYSLSCECLGRLDLGLNSGWVSFRARFIKLFFLFRFRRKMNPKKVLTGGGDRLRGPNARVSLEHPIIQLQTFVSLPTKKITTRKLQAHHIQACAGRRESSRQGAQSTLQGQRKT